MSDNTFVIRPTRLASEPPWSLERSFRGNPNTHAWYLTDSDIEALAAAIDAHRLRGKRSSKEEMNDRGQQFAPGAEVPPRPASAPPSPPVGGYVCPQCGPDPAGADAHAETHHTWDGAQRTTLEMRVVMAEGVIVRPGDTLVIQMPEDTPLDEVDRAFATIKERLPEDCRALVLGGGVHVKVLRDKDSGPIVTFCLLCDDPKAPSRIHHPYGQVEHLPMPVPEVDGG